MELKNHGQSKGTTTNFFGKNFYFMKREKRPHDSSKIELFRVSKTFVLTFCEKFSKLKDLTIIFFLVQTPYQENSGS